MLRIKTLRVVLAAAVFLAVTAFFLDFTQTLPRSLHAITHSQITPALLLNDIDTGIYAGSAVIAVWFVLTLLFGRIYCSVMCPFGILQDVITRLTKTLRRKKSRFQFRAERKRTRYLLLAVFLLGLFILPVAVSILDPYSNFGRILAWIFRPLLLFVNNLLARSIGGVFYFILTPFEFYGFAVALIALLLAGSLSLLWGRRYCNTICPVGTLLGLLSRFSFFKVRLKSGCIACGLCEKTCKGECIDSNKKTVDSSRCVACFNCLSVCKRNSLVYGLTQQPVSEKIIASGSPAAFSPVFRGKPRRRFLLWSIFSVTLGGFMSGKVSEVMGLTESDASPPLLPSGLPAGRSVVSFRKKAAILPPGAGNLKRFRRRCTACHLCISKCPSHVLTPAVTELGFSGFLQPIAKFDLKLGHGFCSDTCTVCADVCPSRALLPISVEERKRCQAGRVIFLEENCVVRTQETNCGACAEHCPTAAVKMRSYGPPEKTLTIPVVDPDLCIGCGACEHICPVQPYQAIYVDGLEQQGKAKPASDPNAKQEEVKIKADDFGF